MMISRFWRWGINAAGSGPKRQLHSITNKNRNINRISSRKWVGHIVLNRRRPPLLLVLDEVLRQPVMWWRMRPWCCLCVILDGKLKLSSWSKSFVALRPLFIFALCSKDQGMYMYYVCVSVHSFIIWAVRCCTRMMTFEFQFRLLFFALRRRRRRRSFSLCRFVDYETIRVRPNGCIGGITEKENETKPQEAVIITESTHYLWKQWTQTIEQTRAQT